MELDKALRGMFDAQNALRSVEGVNNPSLMSLQMMRLSQFCGAVEERLAEYERDYEINLAIKMKEYMLDQKMKATPAEARAKMGLAETKGQIVYLVRLVNSAWKQVGSIQSRINHLVRESQTQM